MCGCKGKCTCNKGCKGDKGEPGIQGAKGNAGANGVDSPTSQIVTAHPSGGQSGATVTTANNVFIDTVGTIGDSVLTLAAVVNNSQSFQNRSGKSANIYPPVGARIEGIAINSPFPLPDGANLSIYCYETGVFVITEFETLPLSSANANLAIGSNWI
jgi:hypothetical protein